MLDKKQREWVGKAARTLGVAEQDEQVEAKEGFDQSMKLLTPRFKQALPHDETGDLSRKVNSAMAFARNGSYIDAQNSLDDAAQFATQVISAQMQPGKEKEGLIGKELPAKYKGEQYQKDNEGNVMPGGEFRKGSDRTKYYNDEEREKSIVHTDEQGRLVDGDGKFLPEKRGFVVSQDKGTLHSFDVSEQGITPDLRTLHTHHSSPIQGGSAAAAGEMETKDGVVRKVSDQSGHYRPTPEMTHQFVEGLQEQGVAMREQKLTMLDKQGKPQDASPEIEKLYKEVNDYEGDRQKTDPTAPYDPEMLKNKQKLQDLGVGMSNRDAQVDVFNPNSMVTPEEFDKVKGNKPEIHKLVEQKIGKKLTPAHLTFGGKTLKSIDSLEKVNNWIGVLSRIHNPDAPEELNKFDLVDTKTTRVEMASEQFAQTGGNVDAIRGKQAVNAEIEKRRKPEGSTEDETKHLQEMITKLGGDAKLMKLGVNDPSTLSDDQKFTILSKGRIPEAMASTVGPSNDSPLRTSGENPERYKPKEAKKYDELAEGESEGEESGGESPLRKSGENPHGYKPKEGKKYEELAEGESEGEEEGDSEAVKKYMVKDGEGEESGGESPLRKSGENPHGYKPKEAKKYEELAEGESEGEEQGDPEAMKKYMVKDGDGEEESPLRKSSENPQGYKPKGAKKYEELAEGESEGEEQGDPEAMKKYMVKDGEGEEEGEEESPLRKSGANPQGYKPKATKKYEELAENESEGEEGSDPEAMKKYMVKDGEGEEESPLRKSGENPQGYKPKEAKKYDELAEGESEGEEQTDRGAKKKYDEVELDESEGEEFPEVKPLGDVGGEDPSANKEKAASPSAQKKAPENVRDLDLKSKKPTTTPHPRQAEYSELGGDQGLLDKMLPAWRSRNKPVLDRLLDFNKRVKTTTGTEKDELAEKIKTLAAELDKRDRMPTLKTLAGMPIDDKIDQLKN